MHLVLRVQTDDALRIETEAEIGAAARGAADRGHHRHHASTVAESDAVQGRRHCSRRRTPPSAQAANEVETNFDRSPGANGTYTFTMKPNVAVTCAKRRSSQARQTIERRVNELGVAEPSIAQQGANGDQILVQLPGVTDVNRAKEIIRSTGLLELKIVEQGPSATQEALLSNGQVPEGMEIVPGVERRRRATPGTVYYMVRKAAAVTGRDLRSARPVARREQPAGGELHAELRRRRASSARSPARTSAAHLAIILDGRVQSAPRIDGRITDDGRISGSFTQEEVQNLSLILRSGLAAGARSPISRSGRSDRASAPTRFAPASSRRWSACC